MGLLSGIGRALSGAVKTLAPVAIKALAPQAVSLLKGIVGDAFSAGTRALNNLASNLPSPLRSLASSLISSLMPKLNSAAEGGIEKLIGKLARSATERFAPGVGNITLPALADRGRAIAETQPATASSSAAATGAGSGAPSNASDLPPAFPSNPNDIGAMNKFNADMQAYQQRLSAMQNYWQMMSNILKSNSDTHKALIANLR